MRDSEPEPPTSADHRNCDVRNIGCQFWSNFLCRNSNKYGLELTSWAYHPPLQTIQRSPFISCLTIFCQNWEWTQPNELGITTQPVMSHFPKHECYILMREAAKSYCKMACIQDWEEFMTNKKIYHKQGPLIVSESTEAIEDWWRHSTGHRRQPEGASTA